MKRITSTLKSYLTRQFIVPGYVCVMHMCVIGLVLKRVAYEILYVCLEHNRVVRTAGSGMCASRLSMANSQNSVSVAMQRGKGRLNWQTSRIIVLYSRYIVFQSYSLLLAAFSSRSSLFVGTNNAVEIRSFFNR